MGATVVTLNDDREVLSDGGILIEDGIIARVGAASRLVADHPEVARVDCGDGVLIPGLVNTHTHLFQTLLKGLGDDRVLKDWFLTMTGPSAAALTKEDCYWAGLHGCAEALLTGTTTVLDFMYVHPQPGCTQAVVDAMTDIGIRGLVARGYMTTGDDSGVPHTLIESAKSALADAEMLIRRHNVPGARVRVGLAPCMIWTVDEATLRQTRALADRTGALITMHVAETDYELQNSFSRFGRRDTAVLEQCGLLGPDLLAVHCVQSDAQDIKMLASHGVKVSHNPCSNLYLGSGVAPVYEMQRQGITVGLATDGPASSNNHSMLQAMKFAALSQKGAHRDAQIITAERVLEMATIDGARAMGMDNEIGSIEVGKRADLVLLKLNNFCVRPLHHVVSALVYSARGDEVDSVWVDGRRVVDGGRLTTRDESDILAASQRSADALVERAGTQPLRNRPWRSVIPHPMQATAGWAIRAATVMSLRRMETVVAFANAGRRWWPQPTPGAEASN